MEMAMSTKQAMKLRKSSAANIARSGNKFYTLLSGRNIPMKQIGWKNHMRTSERKGY